MGIKVTPEQIAWMEEFGTLDQPIAAKGGTVFTLRSLLWAVLGGILIYKGMSLGGPKIANMVPITGLLLIIPGALFVLFGVVPAKSVKREIQFIFLVRILIKRLFSGNKKKPQKKKAKTKIVKQNEIKTKEKKRKKKKTKPVKIK